MLLLSYAILSLFVNGLTRFPHFKKKKFLHQKKVRHDGAPFHLIQLPVGKSSYGVIILRRALRLLRHALL